MTASVNKALLEQAYARAAVGDSGPLIDAIADDVRWKVEGSTSWSRTYVGKHELFTDLLGPLSERLDGPLNVLAGRMIAEDDLVVVEASLRNSTKEGRPYPNRYCIVFRLRDAKIVEVTEYADTQMMAEVLGQRPTSHASP